MLDPREDPDASRPCWCGRSARVYFLAFSNPGGGRPVPTLTARLAPSSGTTPTCPTTLKRTRGQFDRAPPSAGR
jgi:hypothetical protein